MVSGLARDPFMTTTSISVLNQALTRSGNNQISSFTDGSAEAIVANANYQAIVDEMMSLHPWRFALRTATLDLLVDDPLTDGRQQYQLPNDSLRLMSVEANDVEIHWELRDDRIVTRYKVDEPVATFIARMPEPDWPAYFRELVVVALEVLFLRALAEDDRRADRREEVLYDLKMPRARTADSQQSAPDRKFQSRLVGVHRGAQN
jgi:hypothetical protein